MCVHCSRSEARTLNLRLQTKLNMEQLYKCVLVGDNNVGEYIISDYKDLQPQYDA